MRTFACVVFVAGTVLVLAPSAVQAQTESRYRVTITNLTKGQTFTPVLIATHSPSVLVFAPGTQASPQLQVLAEEGATDMLRSTTSCAASIPGPNFMECGGHGRGGRPGRGEGAITVHNGMHGIGDMNRALRDWRGPVARVTIQRLQ